MILVTVGTEQFPFNRLMHWMETILECSVINEDVVIQSGSCTVVPQGATVHSILPENQFKDLVKSARVVISHCGEGSYLLLCQMQVPFILVPRSSAFGEHVDNHQLEMADALSTLGLPIATSPFELITHLARPISPDKLPNPSQKANNLCRMLGRQFPTSVR